ncbi:MAG TPA: hypothetical protein VE987_17175 [Polyangiaceae bacterium]|nr:hypothetical protein [Polyangiaceae bacterium]
METACRAHEGRRFLVVGRPRAQVPLTEVERIALGCARGAGGRFTIAPSAKTAPRVDVFTRSVETTRALQSRRGARSAVKLSVRVLVADRGFEHPTISYEDGVPPDYFARHWRGFSRSGNKEPSLWALVVERVEA